MALKIRPYEDGLWSGLRQFLHEHWQANHPLCNRELFYWQYRGFGPHAGCHNCRVALDGDRIVGFLGAIPGMYRAAAREVPGVALALWVVAREYRNSGLGILLMREAQKQGEVVVCLGVAPSVVRYYRATGYKFLPALHRYVVPLDCNAYCGLLDKPADRKAIGKWVRSVEDGFMQPAGPSAVDSRGLADLWYAGADRWHIALSRTHEFWTWRYAKAVGFEYVQFGDVTQGAVIARLDRVSSTDMPSLDGRCVLRLIEIVPAASDPDAIVAVVRKALAWGRARDAIAADFQCSSDRLGSVLEQAGLRLRTDDDMLTQLPELFNPLRYNVPPINVVVKSNAWTGSDFNSTYLVKSDGDMDRPVRWPES